MKYSIIWLATASLVSASPSVFSVHDDFLAFPQYEVQFSDSFISDKDAKSRLAYAAPSSSARTQATPASGDTSIPSEAATEISRQGDNPQFSAPETSGILFEDAIESYESMILDGKKYICAIPKVEASKKNDTAFAQAKAKAAEQETAELARARNRGWELLKDMEGNCMYFISGWWSYSFCYNTHVKQFHQLPPGKGTPVFPPMEDETTPSYVLGKFGKRDKVKDGIGGEKQSSRGEDNQGTTELQVKGETRYLVQRLGGGTTCDLTGRERRVEIQFHCHPQSTDRIGWIKEVSTCSYLMVIFTPRLCHDVAFLPPNESKAHAITCREVVSEADIPTWQSRKSSLQPKLVSSSSSSARPNVAGIEVGAMKQVGKPGSRLEPPQFIIQPDGGIGFAAVGGKAKFLAKQDKGGKIEKIADEDLKKMGLDPKEIALMRERLKEAAAGKSWKLEVFEGVEGMELRGILQGDENEEDASGQEEGQEEVMATPEKQHSDEEEEENEGSEEIYKDEL